VQKYIFFNTEKKTFFLVFGYTGRTYIDNLTAIESSPNHSITTSGELRIEN